MQMAYRDSNNDITDNYKYELSHGIFVDTVRVNTRCRMLMLAVLIDAVENARKIFFSSGRASEIRKKNAEIVNAKQWLNSKDDSWLFSYGNICRELLLDPEYLRKRISNLDKDKSGKKGKKLKRRRVSYSTNASKWRDYRKERELKRKQKKYAM